MKELPDKKTRQTANVFSLLNKNEIPTAFIEQSGETSITCHDCDMLPLELVMRRFAWGSFLKREPQYINNDGTPHRFDEIRCEFFHKWAVVLPPLVEKTTQMDENQARDKYLKNGVWQSGVYTDPYILVENGEWKLYPPKTPFDPEKCLLTITHVCNEEERDYIINKLMIPTFNILEKAWKSVETEFGAVELADIKIETGRRKSDGKLVIADVIDNDSWRIWPGGDPGKQLDKQNFRDGHSLSKVADNYVLVAELTKQFL